MHFILWVIPQKARNKEKWQWKWQFGHMAAWSHSSLQVLLLDEPTAGLDPCSRHHVWSLLKERQPGRVILFTTQSMDEADTHAGEPRHPPWEQLRCRTRGSPPAPRGVWACWVHRVWEQGVLQRPILCPAALNQGLPRAARTAIGDVVPINIFPMSLFILGCLGNFL